MIDLTGQNILVTGASRGIGKAIAIQLTKCGAAVGIHYNENKDRAEQLADELEDSKLFKANLADRSEVKRLIGDAIQTFGRIHGVVNNAGIAIHSDPEGEDKKFIDDWEHTMKVNLTAVGYLCKMGINHFLKNDGGRIISISSRAAFRGETKDYLAYAASKGGVVSLTRSIARAYGKQNIMAFNVAPGFTQTDMAQDFIDKYGKGIALDDIALNELTQPKDIAPMVAFLLSGLADHATGSTIDMNAGSYFH